MSIEGFIAGLLVLVVGLLWITAPLLRRDADRAGSDALQKHRERLLMIYERVLTNIRDLDEDHSTGKMATADYETERESWVQRGIQVLKALDRLDGQETTAPVIDEQTIDDEIEAAIAAYRSKAETQL